MEKVMKVHQLLDLLADYSPDAEVRLMIQPSYPLESRVAGIVGESEIRAHRGEDLSDAPEIVYLLEGAQVGYGNRSAWEAAECS